MRVCRVCDTPFFNENLYDKQRDKACENRIRICVRKREKKARTGWVNCFKCLSFHSFLKQKEGASLIRHALKFCPITVMLFKSHQINQRT